MSPLDIVRAGKDAVFGWQLYVLKDIKATERTLAQIRAIPEIKFIVLTLDAPFPGKREADERFKMAEVAQGGAPQEGVERTLKILADETLTALRLLGVSKIQDLGPHHVNTAALNQYLFEGPSDLDQMEIDLRPKL
ncbi:hypothetical protein ACHAQF_000866 [Verticillium nonalfalfae]